MANPEHVKIIRQGADVWNQWRTEHPTIKPDLSDTKFFRNNLRRVNLRGANLSSTDLSQVDLNEADLSDAELYWAMLRNTTLRGANLERVRLAFASFYDTSLSGASLFMADLRWAYFIGGMFNNLKLSSALFGNTKFSNNDLSEVIGLGSVKHYAPSSIGIDTLFMSKGEIPEVFLRGCGLPESFINQIPALIASIEPIQFYKCFISFTETDDAFSQKLYYDLQAAGVRCWRWKEDAKMGRTLMRSIDEAVRIYDKLVVICSEASLNSPAVIREIERALQKEDERARQGNDNEVLFPIRLDDYIFNEWSHHRKADLLTKNVGDFCKWKGQDEYMKAFNRLLRDLKTEGKID
jgi:uncharacterized protein YjbI with pentapeptide repeats